MATAGRQHLVEELVAAALQIHREGDLVRVAVVDGLQPVDVQQFDVGIDRTQGRRGEVRRCAVRLPDAVHHHLTGVGVAQPGAEPERDVQWHGGDQGDPDGFWGQAFGHRGADNVSSARASTSSRSPAPSPGNSMPVFSVIVQVR